MKYLLIAFVVFVLFVAWALCKAADDYDKHFPSIEDLE